MTYEYRIVIGLGTLERQHYIPPIQRHSPRYDEDWEYVGYV